ncbi:hypothetical protein CI238_13384 [Colletotrichum incanum]|uniref:Uncharacterized protein n=1 Tax=Colletotrichum incanum TaxID=1573173 RepID=A0A166XWC0_COLIC|nr:hypothetical protein CI238_13384 [Colletotrichum incanum]
MQSTTPLRLRDHEFRSLDEQNVATFTPSLAYPIKRITEQTNADCTTYLRQRLRGIENRNLRSKERLRTDLAL